jgi:hypothetical protein
MTMPKAPMHKDNFLQLWKYQIGGAGEVFAMKPKTVPHPVNQLSDDEFRC